MMSLPSELKGGKIRIGVSGSEAGKDSPRIERAVRRFLSSLAAAGRSRATTASYSRELGRLVDLIGDVPLKEVSPGNLQAAVDQLARVESGGIARHPSTVNRIKSVYRSFFSWCCDSGFIPMNPSAKLKMAKAVARETVPLTKAEIGMLIETIRKSGHPLAMRDEALFAVYAYTGIRRTEALGLRVEDYEPKAAVLRLRIMKGGGSRVLYVPKRLSRILERYLKVHVPALASLPLFPGRIADCPLTPRQAQLRFDLWKKRSGVNASLTIHSFRAGYATLLHKATKDLMLVARAMGHKDLSNTKRYVRLDEDPSFAKPSKKCSDEGKTAGAAWVRRDGIPNVWRK